MNNMQFPLTKRLNAIWITAVIAIVVGMIGAIPIHRLVSAQQLEAIRADIRLIDAAATQLTITDRQESFGGPQFAFGRFGARLV